MHLQDKVEKYDINEAGINLKHYKYFNKPGLINTIVHYNNGIVILSLYINTQILNANYNELSIFIRNITRSTKIVVLCLHETWLSDESTTSIVLYHILHHNKIVSRNISRSIVINVLKHTFPTHILNSYNSLMLPNLN